MSSSDEMLMEFKNNVLKTFEMTDLGQLKNFLGLKIKQSKGSLFVNLQKYVEDLLKRVGMHNSK